MEYSEDDLLGLINGDDPDKENLSNELEEKLNDIDRVLDSLLLEPSSDGFLQRKNRANNSGRHSSRKMREEKVICGVQCYSLREDQADDSDNYDTMEPLLFFENTRAILNKSDDRHRRAYSVHSSTLDCDSDDSDEELFNDIYADLNDLDEFEDFDDEDKVVEGVEVYISSDEEDAPANLFMAEPTEEDILSNSFDASLEEFDQEKESDAEEEEDINETRPETGVVKESEKPEEEAEEIVELNLMSEVSKVMDEMDKPLERSDSCASLKRISFIEDNETKIYSEITDSTFVLPQECDDNPVEGDTYLLYRKSELRGMRRIAMGRVYKYI